MIVTVTDCVRALIEAPSHDAAVELLRVVDASADDVRRQAIEQLDAHLRQTPDRRERHIAETLIALRRAGGAQ